MNLENQKKEFTQKLSRINGFIERNKLDGLALSRQDNFAWATGGSSNWVNTGSETGVAILLFRPKGSPLVVLNNIEAPRLSQEENLLELGFEIIPAPWWQGGPPRDKLLLELVGGEGKQLGIDHSSNNKNFKEIKDLLAPERYILTPEERQRYRKVGQETARCLEELVSGLTPGLTEQEIAGKLAASIYSAGLVPLVTLVAVDERIFNFRHPTPTNKRLKKYAEVVICARGGGLIASCTRLVHFGPLSNELKEKQTATQRVDAVFNLNTRPGTPVREVFERGLAEYAANGFGDEWQLHHQGGGTGYESREFLGTPTARQIVQDSQAFAWNPSITGVKIEDTILVLAGKEPEVLTRYPGSTWPLEEIKIEGLGSMLRPSILIK